MFITEGAAFIMDSGRKKEAVLGDHLEEVAGGRCPASRAHTQPPEECLLNSVHSFTQLLFLKYRLCVPGLCIKAWSSVPGRTLKSGDCWGQVHNQIGTLTQSMGS